jgi:type IV pilus assembly protein PilQ
LQLQINQDRPSNKMVQGMPTISTRQMVANVLAKNGQTIVLGGIYEANTESGQSGLPFLNRVPILCWLFQQHNVRKNKRELLIFVRPKIINEF